MATSIISINPWRVLYKGLLIFLVFNLLYGIWNPTNLGRFSLYNHLLPGRQRFPFGENPGQAYNFSLFDLDAMFASHIINAGQEIDNEYRVILIGDSSVWGILLRPEDTLAGQLNKLNLTICNRGLHFYNLGYPTISLLKDLMVLDYAMRYQPDLIIWFITLEAFPMEKQLTSPIVANNAARVRQLIKEYNLDFDPTDPILVQRTFWDQTIFGQRRNLTDLIRLQMYGILWAATGIDQIYPMDFPPAQTEFDANILFHEMQPPELDESNLAFNILLAGSQVADGTNMLLINEPMLISTGKNSDLRYNFFYPRWAYEQYRDLMVEFITQNEWNYLDFWDLIPDPSYYTNSAIHLTPVGESILAEQVQEAVMQQNCP